MKLNINYTYGNEVHNDAKKSKDEILNILEQADITPVTANDVSRIIIDNLDSIDFYDYDCSQWILFSFHR